MSPKPLGLASNLGYMTQIPGWVGTAGAVNTGINTADQLFEYGEKGVGKTLNDMKDNLNTKHFQNSVVDAGNDILNAVSRPLVSVPLGIREGVKAIAPAFKYRPGMPQSSPMHGATTLMNMNKRSAFLDGMIKAAVDAPNYAPLFAGVAGQGLITFRQNIPAFINKVKAVPNVDYRHLIPLAGSWATRQTAKVLPTDKLRAFAEPNLTGILENVRTNGAPSFKLSQKEAPAFQQFLGANPDIASLATWALTNQISEGSAIGPR